MAAKPRSIFFRRQGSNQAWQRALGTADTLDVVDLIPGTYEWDDGSGTIRATTVDASEPTVTIAPTRQPTLLPLTELTADMRARDVTDQYTPGVVSPSSATRTAWVVMDGEVAGPSAYLIEGASVFVRERWSHPDAAEDHVMDSPDLVVTEATAPPPPPSDDDEQRGMDLFMRDVSVGDGVEFDDGTRHILTQADIDAIAAGDILTLRPVAVEHPFALQAGSYPEDRIVMTGGRYLTSGAGAITVNRRVRRADGTVALPEQPRSDIDFETMTYLLSGGVDQDTDLIFEEVVRDAASGKQAVSAATVAVPAQGPFNLRYAVRRAGQGALFDPRRPDTTFSRFEGPENADLAQAGERIEVMLSSEGVPRSSYRIEQRVDPKDEDEQADPIETMPRLRFENGNPYLEFDGVDDCPVMSWPSSARITGVQWSLFFLYRSTAREGCLMSANGRSAQTSFALKDGGMEQGGIANDGSPKRVRFNGVVTEETPEACRAAGFTGAWTILELEDARVDQSAYNDGMILGALGAGQKGVGSFLAFDLDMLLIVPVPTDAVRAEIMAEMAARRGIAL